MTPTKYELPYLLWEGNDGLDDIRLIVKSLDSSGNLIAIIEVMQKDALGEDSWSYHRKYTHAINEAETFVPCLVSGLVDLLMR